MSLKNLDDLIWKIKCDRRSPQNADFLYEYNDLYEKLEKIRNAVSEFDMEQFQRAVNRQLIVYYFIVTSILFGYWKTDFQVFEWGSILISWLSVAVFYTVGWVVAEIYSVFIECFIPWLTGEE